MRADDWSKALDELRENLVTVERKANDLLLQLPALCKILESLKVDILKSKLEKERRHAARVQGVAAIKQDKGKLGMSLGLGVAGLVLGGALSRDSNFALSTGLGAFDATLQQFGKSLWTVSLDRTTLVVPRDQITAGRFWVTWESLNKAMEKLQKSAYAINEKLLEIEEESKELIADVRTQDRQKTK